MCLENIPFFTQVTMSTFKTKPPFVSQWLHPLIGPLVLRSVQSLVTSGTEGRWAKGVGLFLTLHLLIFS